MGTNSLSCRAADRLSVPSLGLQISGLSPPASADPKEARNLEGRTHRTSYLLLLNLSAGKRSTLEIAHDYEHALKEVGFEPVWSGGDNDKGVTTSSKSRPPWGPLF